MSLDYLHHQLLEICTSEFLLLEACLLLNDWTYATLFCPIHSHTKILFLWRKWFAAISLEPVYRGTSLIRTFWNMDTSIIRTLSTIPKVSLISVSRAPFSSGHLINLSQWCPQYSEVPLYPMLSLLLLL